MIRLLPGPELAGLPLITRDSTVSTRLGCAGTRSSDDTDCSTDSVCTPDIATICSATGVVMAFDDARIGVQIGAIDLTVAP